MTSPSAYGPEFFADFTMLPYGPPVIPGLALYDSSRGGGAYQDAHLICYNRSLLSVGRAGVCAAYAEQSMGAPVTRIGADFRIGPGSYGGSLALALWAKSWGVPTWQADGVPDAPLHMIVNLTDWAYQVYESGKLVGLASGTFSPPLPPNAQLRVDVYLDRAKGTATLWLPNGQVVTVTDPRIQRAAPYAVFESWRMYAESQGNPAILTAWADTR